jgi:hypothetical protein
MVYVPYALFRSLYTGTQYTIIAEVASKMGMQIDDQMYTLLWTDAALSLREIKNEPQHTKINHFP